MTNSQTCFALMGWSLPVIESLQKLGKPFVVVSFPDFEPYAKENNIPFVSWAFDKWNDESNSLVLAEKLQAHNATVAVPLFEETVEWAGALNSIFRNDPRVLNRAFLFRNKAMMKRKALLGGLRVGYFEEVFNKEQVEEFMKRLNEAELVLNGESDAWVHLKPFDAAGTVGHKLLRTKEDIDKKLDNRKDFPSLVESHLRGQEFSCEAFIHNGKVRFLNITEYVKLGYSNFIPCGPELKAKRPAITKEIEKLVKVFGIEYGMIHPEFFINENDEISFGEVACRIPGGHILEILGKAYNFDALAAFVLCHDPKTTDEELDAIFPENEEAFVHYNGALMVHPGKGHITKLAVPEELTEDPYFEEHTLVPLLSEQKIGDREGFGNHYGTVFLQGDDPGRMKEMLTHYQDVPFYV
ncbi:acetyl-CoA carboxylase biotin carboxylase subunit family protein [Roseivirga sp. BDSF3-8]|uniref:ATP-grasp domain-containing protein n=1 Tax=Roseivirga sp. BDSF3-8 TaxID=3241598 RepID=UPI0035320921